MKVSDQIEIQYRQKNAQFRVVWITAGVSNAGTRGYYDRIRSSSK
jgi:hypothetical protein